MTDARVPSASPAIGRRSFLGRTAAAGIATWAVPTVLSTDPVAAATGSALTVVTAELEKVTNGNRTIPGTEVCKTGSQSVVGRGTVTFTRASPAEICAEVTLSTGTDITGREVHILQSAESNSGFICAQQVSTPVGVWAATPASGPQTFCAPVLGGATHFVLWLSVSGGGGNDDYATEGPVAVPAP